MSKYHNRTKTRKQYCKRKRKEYISNAREIKIGNSKRKRNE